MEVQLHLVLGDVHTHSQAASGNDSCSDYYRFVLTVSVALELSQRPSVVM